MALVRVSRSGEVSRRSEIFYSLNVRPSVLYVRAVPLANAAIPDRVWHGTGVNYEHSTINDLPDNVLLEIFHFCRWKHVREYLRNGLRPPVWQWHIPAHVCQRWRHIVFASPQRLHLQIFCTYGTPVRKSLYIWPTFPIVIGYDGWEGYRYDPRTLGPTDEDNIIAALEKSSRIREIRLRLPGLQLGRITTMMQEQLLTLARLVLSSEDSNIPALPSQFLGRSAPHLQELTLDGIPFPTLPILLQSATDLIALELHDIPQTGYISPKAMVAALATLTRLKALEIGFRSSNARPDKLRLPLVSRTVLPALTSFIFRGVNEYLEDFAARIELPLLRFIVIRYFNQLVDFEVPQLSRLVNRSESFKRPMRCIVKFRSHRVFFRSGAITLVPESFDVFPYHIEVGIVCEGMEWQVSHLTQALSQISATLSNTIDFAVDFDSEIPESEVIDNIEWLQLLSLFSSMRTLFVPKRFAGHVAKALEDFAGVMTAEVLPALDMLCLDRQSMSSVDKFIAVRQDSGLPVIFVNTETELRERIQSYKQEIREVALFP
jgi:hypothetical protein